MPVSLPAIVIAIALLGLVATSVQPSVRASDKSRLDSSAQQLAALFRLAQAETLRTNQEHGIVFDATQRSFSMVQADTAVEPFGTLAVAYHPVRKQPAVWQADEWLTLTPSSDVFDYSAAGMSNQLLFDAWGTPLLPIGGVRRQLAASTIVLETASHTLSVTLSPMNGRVTVQ